MSYRVTIKCNNCSYKESFIIGQKRSDANISRIIEEIDEENRDILNKIISEDNLLSFTFYRELGGCSSCKKYYVVPILNVYTKQGDVIKLIGNCKSCSKNLTVYSDLDNANGIECLKCNSGELEIDRETIFD